LFSIFICLLLILSFITPGWIILRFWNLDYSINYVPSLLALSYTNNIKREISPNKHMWFCAIVGCRYWLERIGYIM